MVERTPVSSSNIHSVGYDHATKTLAVEFKNGGGVYHYHDVPKDAHEAFVSAKSLGSHFHTNIKNAYKNSKQ